MIELVKLSELKKLCVDSRPTLGLSLRNLFKYYYYYNEG
jgi:hypothetical protein